MSTKFSGKESPLLRNLILIQVAAILTSSVGVYFAYKYVSESNFNSAAAKLRLEVATELSTREDKWRAWRQLGLDDALQGELEAFRQKLRLESLKVVPSSELTTVDIVRSIVLPETRPNDPKPLNVVVAKLDLSAAEATHLPNRAILFVLLVSGLLFVVVVLFSAQYVWQRIHQPLQGLNSAFDRFSRGEDFDLTRINATGEMRKFVRAIETLYARVKDTEKRAVMAEVADRVEHDIRSPLEALEMMLPMTAPLPEKHRVILRNAVSRIRDIANELKAKKVAVKSQQAPTSAMAAPSEKPSVQLLSSLVESVVSEKRLTLGNREVLISTPLDSSSYGMFVLLRPGEFKRHVSNILNNALEAISENGSIRIGLETAESNRLLLTVEDTGRGISPEILARVGECGFSYGKSNGSGLGLFHAKKAIQELGGALTIQSRFGVGTKVTLDFPAARPPSWFVPALDLGDARKVVIVDDDQSIHDVWQERLAGHAEKGALQLVRFNDGQALKGWLASNPDAKKHSLFLMDYELLGQDQSGLDLIESLQISQNSILVTSRFEEKKIEDRVKWLDVKMVPKGLAHVVPIRIAAD
ncbi:MAG: hypothetical protein HY074_05505 [Deltaproteobacteria bacterium]|nr:hypothetical protein [Deltaproteobacteria bacterium]